jgi:ketosteroid isomerase-like protein
MKKTLIVITFLLTVVVVNAQRKADKAVTKKIEQLRKAMIDADAAMLTQLTDDNLSYGHSSGAIDDKKMFVEKITSGQSDFVTLNLSQQTITVTKHTAIVRHVLKATTNDNGKPGEVNLKVLLVWHKANGEWKLLARQAVKTS